MKTLLIIEFISLSVMLTGCCTDNMCGYSSGYVAVEQPVPIIDNSINTYTTTNNVTNPSISNVTPSQDVPNSDTSASKSVSVNVSN